MYEIWSYQVAYAGQGRADQVRDRLDGRLNEFKVSEGEDLLDCNLSILVLVGSLNKVLQQVAHQCQLLSEQGALSRRSNPEKNSQTWSRSILTASW